MSKKTLLATEYPSADEWKLLLRSFSSEAIAHRLLLSSVPFVFRASLNVLGLQLSHDTVSQVNGRIARSFDDAIRDLAANLRRLKFEINDGETQSYGKSKSSATSVDGGDGDF